MHRNVLSSMLIAVIVASILLSAASAAPVIKRVELSAERAAKDTSWGEMAAMIGLPFKNVFLAEDGSPAGNATNLPTPCVGRMYGGAWGTTGSDLKIMAGGWQLWHQAECPGVLGAAPDGVIVHAQLGANGTKFLFVGTNTGAGTTTTEASGLAAQLNAAINNQEGADWTAFDNAVAESTTGIKMDLVLKKLKVHYNAETGKLDKGVAKADEKKAGEKPAKGKGRIPMWLLITCFVLGLGAFYFASTSKTTMGKALLIILGIVMIAPAIMHFAGIGQF